MTVNDLIELLKVYDKDLPVCVSLWSEQVLLEADDIKVVPLCEPRNDGWVANARPDKPTINYLLLH
jgi:hypothetical protein